MSTTYTRLQHRVEAPEKLTRVRFVVGSAFTLSATNYWTIGLYWRTAARGVFAADTAGKLVGAVYTLQTRSLVAGEPVTLYDVPAGLSMREGDSLWALYIANGSPVAMDNPTMLLDLEPVTR